MASQAPFYFDNSTFDIYGSLRAGAKLYLIPENMFHFPSKLPELLAEKHVTSIFWVPTVMINIANSGVLEGISLPDLKNVAFAGEVEAGAMCIPGTQNACAVFDSARQRIVLFVESDEEIQFHRYNRQLLKYIPSYMLPSKIITYEKLPHTANDKIDRVTLRKVAAEAED